MAVRPCSFSALRCCLTILNVFYIVSYLRNPVCSALCGNHLYSKPSSCKFKAISSPLPFSSPPPSLQAISLFLIGIVVAARALAYFTNLPILAGLAVCACVLFLVAILGLMGTIKHHQVILFFVSKPETFLHCFFLLSFISLSLCPSQLLVLSLPLSLTVSFLSPFPPSTIPPTLSPFFSLYCTLPVLHVL